MKFLIDHCVLGMTKIFLQEKGFPLITLTQLGKTSATNGEVIQLAKAHNAILLTCDSDFADLRLYPVGTHKGIIVLKIPAGTEDKVHKVLETFLKEVDPSQIAGALVVIDRNKYRVRREGI